MSVGICSWAFHGVLRGHRPVSELAEVAAAHGFGALEAAYSPRSDFGGINQAFGSAVRVTSLATLELFRTPVLDGNSLRRQHAWNTLHEMCRVARAHGIPTISFSPGPMARGTDPARLLSEFVASMTALLETGREQGVRIAVENVPGHLLDRRATMAKCLAALPDLGLCLDIGNALVDEPIEAWIEEFRQVVLKVHLSDGAVRDSELQPTNIGSGQVAWSTIVPIIASNLAGAPWFIEARLPVELHEDEFLETTYRCVARALAL